MSPNNIIQGGRYSIETVLDINLWQRTFAGKKKVNRPHKKRLKVWSKSVNCAYCGIKGSFIALENFKKTPNKKWFVNLYAEVPNGGSRLMTIDHVIPRSKGGKNNLSNMVTACCKCNWSKNDMPLEKWLKHRKCKRIKYPIRVTNWKKTLVDWRVWVRRLKYMWYTKKLPGLPTKLKWVESDETEFYI